MKNVYLTCGHGGCDRIVDKCIHDCICCQKLYS